MLIVAILRGASISASLTPFNTRKNTPGETFYELRLGPVDRIPTLAINGFRDYTAIGDRITN
jgi:hypothetical protein